MGSQSLDRLACEQSIMYAANCAAGLPGMEVLNLMSCQHVVDGITGELQQPHNHSSRQCTPWHTAQGAPFHRSCCPPHHARHSVVCNTHCDCSNTIICFIMPAVTSDHCWWLCVCVCVQVLTWQSSCGRCRRSQKSGGCRWGWRPEVARIPSKATFPTIESSFSAAQPYSAPT